MRFLLHGPTDQNPHGCWRRPAVVRACAIFTYTFANKVTFSHQPYCKASKLCYCLVLVGWVSKFATINPTIMSSFYAEVSQPKPKQTNKCNSFPYVVTVTKIIQFLSMMICFNIFFSPVFAMPTILFSDPVSLLSILSPFVVF